MDIDFHALLPELILSGTILVVLVVDVFLPERAKWFAMPLGLVGVATTLVAVLTLVGAGARELRRYLRRRRVRPAVQGFFLVVAAVVLALWCGTSVRAASTRASTTSCC